MSREAYQVPTAQGISGSAGQKYGGRADYMRDDAGPIMQCLCGDCGDRQSLNKADPIRCKNCGCRVLYKERTKR